jgi:hypothetical protein
VNGSKLYASVKYRRPAMKRMIVAVSHSVKALRRKHGGHIFAVTKTPIPASQCGLNEYTIVGKEIKA